MATIGSVDHLTVHWKDAADHESGVEKFKLTLFSADSCDTVDIYRPFVLAAEEEAPPDARFVLPPGCGQCETRASMCLVRTTLKTSRFKNPSLIG